MSLQAEWPKTPESRDDESNYFRVGLETADTGETVWLQRNFEGQRGRVLDLFTEGRHQGYIHQDWDLGGRDENENCTAYINRGPDNTPEPIIRRNLTFHEAGRILLEEVFPTEPN